MIRYPQVMKLKEVVCLLRRGVYRVDRETGDVFGKGGERIVPFVGNKMGHLYVRLYAHKKRKAIAVARLIWMSVTLQSIPPRYEVHHRDEDARNNAWNNLICLHRLDHRKMHEEEEIADVPF